jgi:hypothetical protein
MMKFLSDMTARRIPPNEVTLSSIINVYANKGDVVNMTKFLDIVERMSIQIIEI